MRDEITKVNAILRSCGGLPAISFLLGSGLTPITMVLGFPPVPTGIFDPPFRYFVAATLANWLHDVWHYTTLLLRNTSQ
jgi:hypothetical protein